MKQCKVVGSGQRSSLSDGPGPSSTGTLDVHNVNVNTPILRNKSVRGRVVIRNAYDRMV